MKNANLGQQSRARSRRTAGRAQQDHILDPYQRQQKADEGTSCPHCGAVFHNGRWQWAVKAEAGREEACPACRRIADKLPAGIVTVNGPFAPHQKDELVSLARHEEEAEKLEHPLNRIIGIEEDGENLVISTTDIHLPRRIGEAVRRAFHRECEMDFDQAGYFVRVTCSPSATSG
jgi:hypothetical protein